ncbi:hypothetical protein MXD59_08780 [Frankia sp. Ag45/Mut15]|uniref:Uncharacterized protein n=1 Tax=Frankia umida TaxID=573489 RepID=A0ABT0JWE0_9ACTN|nr:hypothetical protein [Frankia umida]MCK9875865.1 hypothetical protein [Frankia umida]
MNTAEFLIGPTVLVVVLGLLLIAARWASTPLRALPRGIPLGHDFGLLVPVAIVDTPAEVTLAQAVLCTQGIRSTWAMAMTPLHIDASGNILSRPRHRRHVLVFGVDAARATRTLHPPRGGQLPYA